jgi:hypothetical protein
MKITTPDFRGFSFSHEKQTVIDSVEYSKEMTCQEVKVLDEVAVEE